MVTNATVPAGNVPFVDASGVLTAYGRNLLVQLLKGQNAVVSPVVGGLNINVTGVGPSTISTTTNVLTDSNIRTLTNKTIDGASNTLNVRLGSDVSGNLTVGHLNGGTSASSSTFWRGDGQWVTPPVGTGTVTNVATGTGLTGGPITTTGTVSLASQAAFSANLSANQTGVLSATPTLIAFNTTSFNVGSLFNTGTNRWTPPAGTVAISAGMFATNGTGTIPSGGVGAIFLYKNGAAFLQTVAIESGGSAQVYATVIDRCNGTDFYQVYAYVSLTGGVGNCTLTGGTGPLLTFFQGSWLCP
jgi:hypothetical protein